MYKTDAARLTEVWITIRSIAPANSAPEQAVLAYYNNMTATQRKAMSAAMSQGAYAPNLAGTANEKNLRKYRRALILILMSKRNSGVVTNDQILALNALAANMTGDQAEQRCRVELMNTPQAIGQMIMRQFADINWGGWDGTRQRPLLAGCAIGRRGANGPGTLGCFLTDGAGAIYILSNQHVLHQHYNAGGNVLAADDNIIQPPHQLGGSYLDDVAVLHAVDAVHDAAIARVKPGITCSNTTVNGIAIGGSAIAANNGAVRKDGCASRLRHATVTNAASPNVNNGTTQLTHQLLVDIDVANDAYQNRIFQIQGDSGSVLIDANDNVVALMHGQASAVQGQATHITPILTQFNLQVMVGVHVAQ